MDSSNLGANLGRLLAEAAQRFGFRDLLSQANEVRAALAHAGLARHEPVHVRVSNRTQDLAAYLGVWLAGGVVVPVLRSSPEGAVAHTHSKTRSRFEVDSGVRVLGNEPPPRRSMLEGAALIVFTSGSSGMPKGAVLSHRAFAGKLAAIQSLLGFHEHDRTLLVLNITFSFGIWVALLTLLHGGRLLMRERFSAATFLEELAEEKVTRVAVVPTMMRSLILDLPPQRLQAAGRALAERGALRHVLIGGETLGQGLGETLRRIFAPAELVIYGLTETSTCDLFLGRPSPGVRYRIAEDGELWISSPFLMNGYLDEHGIDPIVDGWLATGDLAGERDPGVVELGGRKKELIYRGGSKIAPLEIEFACTAHPKVAAALAVGRSDERLGQRIHALIVPREPGLDAAELRSFLAQRLDRYKQPDVLYFAAELPAGRTGKADRGRFSAMLDAGELTPAEGEGLS